MRPDDRAVEYFSLAYQPPYFPVNIFIVSGAGIGIGNDFFRDTGLNPGYFIFPAAPDD